LGTSAQRSADEQTFSATRVRSLIKDISRIKFFKFLVHYSILMLIAYIFCTFS